ncbi:MAG: hypothetical protein AAGB22_13965 [Bacteroidota bacterium]
MKRSLKLAPALLLGFAMINFTACDKDNEETEDFAATEDEALAIDVDNSTETDADAVTFKNGLQGGECAPWRYLSGCATVTDTNATYPKTITIDFGSGCTNAFGRTRSGIIRIELTDDLHHEGAVRTVRFDGYAVNGHAVTGSRVLTNTGANAAGNITFSRSVNLEITGGRGTLTGTFEGQVEWLSGYDTEECGDNVFALTGTGTRASSKGHSATREIIDPLIIDRVCGYATGGVVEISRSNGRSASINFGDGSCDDVATVTRNGISYEMDLDNYRVRKWRR